MEKKVEISILCEIYGKLLTEKQRIFLEDYYNNDLYNFIISSFVGSFGFPGLQASSIAD